jgi:hypothetical protein
MSQYRYGIEERFDLILNIAANSKIILKSFQQLNMSLKLLGSIKIIKL